MKFPSLTFPFLLKYNSFSQYCESKNSLLYRASFLSVVFMVSLLSVQPVKAQTLQELNQKMKEKEVVVSVDNYNLSIYPAMNQPSRLEKSIVLFENTPTLLNFKIGDVAIGHPELSALKEIDVLIVCEACSSLSNEKVYYSIQENRSSAMQLKLQPKMMGYDNKETQLSLIFSHKGEFIKQIKINTMLAKNRE